VPGSLLTGWILERQAVREAETEARRSELPDL
jgi:hypothetical protein